MTFILPSLVAPGLVVRAHCCGLRREPGQQDGRWCCGQGEGLLDSTPRLKEVTLRAGQKGVLCSLSCPLLPSALPESSSAHWLCCFSFCFQRASANSLLGSCWGVLGDPHRCQETGPVGISDWNEGAGLLPGGARSMPCVHPTLQASVSPAMGEDIS